MKPLYFGYQGSGHHAYRAKGGYLFSADYDSPEDYRFNGFTAGELDGNFCPKDITQAQGFIRLTHDRGCTVLAFWDRTGDGRRNSHSTFVLPGTLTVQEALFLAILEFPTVFARVLGRVRLRYEA